MRFRMSSPPPFRLFKSFLDGYVVERACRPAQNSDTPSPSAQRLSTSGSLGAYVPVADEKYTLCEMNRISGGSTVSINGRTTVAGNFSSLKGPSSAMPPVAPVFSEDSEKRC